jgi:hypothetical protein
MFDTLKRMKENGMLNDEMIERAISFGWITEQGAEILRNI